MRSMDDDDAPDEVRDATEIARRALALFGAVGVALGAPREEVIAWLEKEELWDDLSPSERAYLLADPPAEQQTVNMSWNSERLAVLLWALERIDQLPAPNEQCDTSVFQQHLPPFSGASVAEFLLTAKRRSDEVLLGMADRLMDLHWRARDARYRNRQAPADLNIEVIQERHHAINWVIGYDKQPWDEVTTDT